jgi:hypothetical protein
MDNIPEYIYWKDEPACISGATAISRVSWASQNPESIVGRRDQDLSWRSDQAETLTKSDGRVVETDTPE